MKKKTQYCLKSKGLNHLVLAFLLPLALLLSSSSNSLGQAAPGGETMNLNTWFKADLGTSCATDLCTVADWTTSGGSVVGDQAIPGGGAGTMLFNTGAFNFNPGVNIVDKYMTIGPRVLDELAIFIVFKTNEAGTNGTWFRQPGLVSGYKSGVGNDWGLTMDDGEINWNRDGSDQVVINRGTMYNTGEARMVSVRRGNNGAADLFLNGEATGGGATGVTGPLQGTDSIFFAGKPTDSASWDGTIAEVIIYDFKLGIDERRRIHSYLAIKYGIQIDDDYRASDNSLLFSNDAYNNETVGIGRDDDSALDQRQSRPASDGDGLTLYHGIGLNGSYPAHNTIGSSTNPNAFPTDLSYLVVGHDDGSDAFGNGFGGGAGNRVTRVYRATETGSMGPVTLRFNSLEFTELAEGGQYYLVESDNPVLGLPDKLHPMYGVPGTDNFYAEVDFPSGDSYFSVVRHDAAPGNYSSDLNMWHKADGMVDCFTDGCAVADWDDEMGDPDRDGTKGGLGTVTLEHGEMNSNPVLRLTDGFMEFPAADGVTSFMQDDFTVFVVASTNYNNLVNNTTDWWEQSAIFSGDADDDTDFMDFGMTMGPGGEVYWGIRNDWDVVSSASFDDGNAHIFSGDRDRNNNTNNDDSFLWVDGTEWGPGDGGDATFLTQVNNFRIGRHPDGDGRLDGDFAEVISYNRLLNNGQQDRVESYLGLKYGITLDHDYVNYDGNVNTYGITGFGSDIIGIGTDFRTSLDQRQSRPAGDPTGLGIYNGDGFAGVFPAHNNRGNDQNPNLLLDGQFLVTGHDNALVTFNQSYNGFPNTQMERVFKITNTENTATSSGFVGPVTLLFDDGTFTNLQAGVNYKMLVGTNPVPAFGDTEVDLVPVPSSAGDFYCEYTFPGGDSYFTLIRPTEGAPGGVDSLSLWVRGDMGANAPLAPFTWTDFSGDGNDLVTSAPLPTVSVAPLINYNPFVQVTDTLQGNFLSVNPLDGQAIFFVARTTAAGAPNPVLMGWQGGYGLYGSSSIPAPLVDNSNSPISNFLNGGAVYENGRFKTVSADIDEWTIVSAVSGPLVSGSGTFHVGAGTAQTFYTTHDFSEIVVLDSIPSMVQRQRIQSYLAIRHGLTHEDQYRDSDGTLIYPFGTAYDNNIIAIGRDDASLLTQRQSKSEHADGIIAIGVGDIVTTNQLNTGLLNDKEFLFLSNNGGNSCLKTAEGVMDTTFGNLNYLIADRKWKFTPVNGFSESIDFEVDMDDPDFDIGDRPVGSSFYFLITDNDDDLTNGFLDTLQFWDFTNPWSRTITSADYLGTAGGNGVYFTIATYLADPVWTFDDYCSGQTLELIGSTLADSNTCVSLHFNDGNQSFSLVEGPASTDSTFTILSSSTSNFCLDTLSWVISDSFASLNNYTITVDTSAGPCGLNPLIPTDALVFLDSLSIGSSGSSTFSYVEDTVCIGGNNILPIIPAALGTPGQFFIDTTSNAQVNASPGLLLDSSGTLYVNSLSDGFHKICYTLAGDCVAETCDSVVIEAPVSLSLIVPNSQICVGAVPDTLVPNVPGGMFSSIPALLTPTFASTGAIDTQFEQPGTYQVTYDFPLGDCYQPVSITIVISTPIQPIFSYNDTIICTNTLLTTISPVLQQLPNGGGTFAYNAVGVGVLNLNGVNGNITPPFNPDVYTIRFDPAGGGCTLSDSVQIEIVDPPVITAFGLDSSYCIDNVNPSVVPASPAGGFMEDLSGLLDSLYLDGTGWNLLPRGPIGGPFPVRYTYTDPTTGCSQSQTQLTELVGVAIPTWEFDTTIYCIGSGPMPRPTLLSGQGGGTFSASIGININPNTGEIDWTGIGNGASVDVFYTDTVNGCVVPTQTITPISLRFFTPPDPTFVLGGNGVDSLCPGVDTLLFSGASGFGQYSLLLGGVPIDTLGNNGIALDSSFLSGTNYEIQRVVFRNQAPGCRDSLSEFFYLHPLESGTFDYGLDSITLCSNAPDVFPALYGDGGGLFSSATAILDDSTGLLFLDSTYTNDSLITTHTIFYETQGDCPDIGTTVVRILPGRVTFFEYLASIVCNNVPQFLPDSVATPGGVFSCPNCPSGVNIDAATGSLDVANVPSDTTLEINYAFSDSTCADTTRRFISVEAYDTALEIEYPLVDYCPTGTETPSITVSDTSSIGVFLPVFGVNISNTSTGEIDLGSSTPGGYLVRYRLNGECAEIVTDTITVLEPDDAQFTYPTPTVCEGTDSLMGAVLDDPASQGMFTWNYSGDPAAMTVDLLTGEIDLGNSDPGVFWVTHTSGGQCTEIDSQRVVISSLPDIGNLQVFPSDSVCGEDTVEVRITSGGIPLFIVDSVLIPNTPILTIENPEDGQLITGIVRTTDGCADTATVTITQNIVPRGDVGTWPNTVSGDEEIEIIIQALTDETSFAWTTSSSDNVSIEIEGDTTDVIDSGGDVSIVNNVELTSDFYPGTMEYAIVPFTENCRGDTIFLPIAINPNNQAIFIPGVFTPNGDTKNDTWQIQWRSDIDPDLHIIEVYNRTGGLVYTMEGLISTWTGDNLPDGVYWYLVKDPVGETIMAGGLTIRRR